MRQITLLFLIIFLSACDGLGQGPFPVNMPFAPTLSTAQAVTVTPVLTAETATPAIVPSPSPTIPPEIILWVPPEFDPSSGTPAGNILENRLKEFSRRNDGVRVNVRVKAGNGPGGLLESLNAAYGAAPINMPSVVALSRPDLETAALKGLIQPLDGVSTAIDEEDWYDYARQLAMVQGATFGLPFAGDAQLIVYRPARVVAPPADWPAVFRLAQPLAFPASDPQALFLLSLYRSLGGTVEDAQRRPTLDPEILSQVLQTLADGEKSGIFPSWLTQYETNAQLWQGYQDLRVNALVTWASTYLSTLPPDSTAAVIPSLNESPLTLATGWGWAVADPIPERRAVSIRLAEFLTESEFLSEWTEVAGYLPTRPSALAAWSNQNLKTLLSSVAVSANARPSSDQLAALGPVLKEATLKILKRESDPAQAAQTAVDRLLVPESR